MFLKQKAEELLEIYFILVSLAECVRHSLVLSIMQVNMRIGPNTCITNCVKLGRSAMNHRDLLGLFNLKIL